MSASPRGRALIVTPTRERPLRCHELITAWRDLSECSDLALYVDDDDSSNYDLPDDVIVVRGPRLGLVGSTNYLVNTFPHYDFYASLGDDHVPRTQGWDRMLIDALGEQPGIAYGDDLLQGKYCPTAPLMSAAIVHGLGWMGPATLRHMFIDRFWEALGNALGRLIYVPDVIIEHLHPAIGKAESDATYEASNNEAAFDEDHRAFLAYMDTAFAADLLRVQQAL